MYANILSFISFFYRDFTFNKDYGSVTYALFKVKKGANLTFEPTKMEFIYVNKYSQYAYNKFIFFSAFKNVVHERFLPVQEERVEEPQPLHQ